MTDTVLYATSDAIATVTLNRPERLNAINPELLADLLGALRKANADPAVHVIVLGGAGRAFCAGDDLKEFDSQDTAWAHIDIAGPVWSDKGKGVNPAGATGYGVRTLVNWVCAQA